MTYSSEYHFGQLYVNDEVPYYVPSGFIPKSKNLSFSCYAIDWDERHWVGTLHGLYEFIPEKKQLIPQCLGHPALDERVSDLIYLPGGKSLLFGTRGQGLVYYDTDTIFQISSADGLVSNSIRKLFLDEEGVVWVATYSGLSRVEFVGFPGEKAIEASNSNGPAKKANTLSFHIRSFNLAHGLLSTELSYISESENYLWLASDLGLLKFKPPAIDSLAKAPKIEDIFLNGNPCRADSLQSLAAASNYTLDLHFTSLDFSSLGQNTYRYRLSKQSDWREIKRNELSFPSLPVGNYVFELQSQNADGFWSSSLHLPIYVATRWYKRWWSITLAALTLVAFIIAYFFRRERQRIQAQAIQQQISELERSALQAQMNPHFVFNSLNSIQKFVIHQETEAAVDYLARFARLIRETLRISAKGVH
ncbi:MAG: histidine kinase, partial [Bacteroidota bacterium]